VRRSARRCGYLACPVEPRPAEARSLPASRSPAPLPPPFLRASSRSLQPPLLCKFGMLSQVGFIPRFAFACSRSRSRSTSACSRLLNSCARSLMVVPSKRGFEHGHGFRGSMLPAGASPPRNWWKTIRARATGEMQIGVPSPPKTTSDIPPSPPKTTSGIPSKGSHHLPRPHQRGARGLTQAHDSHQATRCA